MPLQAAAADGEGTAEPEVLSSDTTVTTAPTVHVSQELAVPVTAPAWGFEGELALLGRVPVASQHGWHVAEDHLGVSDTELDAAEVEGLQVRAVSSRGLEHRLHATVRQDAYAFTLSADRRWLLLAVSDGVGSAPDSHRGSRLATRAALLHLRDKVGDDGIPTWEDLAAEATCVAASALADVTQACTLVVTAVEVGTSGGDRTALLARVGDSTALRLHDGRLEDCFAGDVEAVHSTATDCLPRHPNRIEVVRSTLTPGAALLLATDGFYGPALTGAGAAHVARAWATPPGIDRLLADVHLLARTYDDDRTVVGCWAPAADEAQP